MADLSISLGGAAILLVGLVSVAFVAALLFYRVTLPPLPQGVRALLFLLRSISLACLVIILFEPTLRLSATHNQAPAVAILIDDSQSMAITDGAALRRKAARKAVADAMKGSFPKGIDVQTYLFSVGTKRIDELNPDTISFSGEETDISQAFDWLKENKRLENLRAAILISDGNYTSGRNPLLSAEALSIPVSTIGIGDTADQKDVLIERAVSNELVTAETSVPVDIVLKSSGYDGDRVVVSVDEEGTVLDRTTVTLRSGMREIPLKLHIVPNEEGMKKYTVTVSRLAGEVTTRNNSRSFFMKVLKNKMKVVLLAGAPDPDVSAILQALIEDGHLAIEAGVQQSPGRMYGRNISESSLDSADCIVLVGFPSSATSDAFMHEVRSAIIDLKKPFLFVGGRGIDFQKLSMIEQALPFSWGNQGEMEVLVGASVPDREVRHPLIALNGSTTADTWSKLPPVYKDQTPYKAKPEAEVLAFVTLRDIALSEPLVALRDVARQKSVAVTGHRLWRWRLMGQSNPQTAVFLQLFMTNCVRWLTTKDTEKRVRVSPVKESYTSAEPIEFTGQVYDEQSRPVDNATVTVNLQFGKEILQLPLTSVGNGRYEGRIDHAGEGDYSYTARALAQERSLGEDQGKFSVGQTNMEFLETKMNKSLLEQIAFRTGGKYYNADAAASTLRDLSSLTGFTPLQTVQTTEMELWNWRYLAGLIVMLLVGEWFFRKRYGMV